MVYEQDYILRLIQRVGVFLRAMYAALREHRPTDAIQLSEEALHHITGLSSDAAVSMSTQNLVLLLSAGGRLDVKRTLLLVEVLAERAEAFEQQGDEAAAAGERAKAAALARAAVTAAPDSDDGDRARMLLAQIEGDAVPGMGDTAPRAEPTEPGSSG